MISVTASGRITAAVLWFFVLDTCVTRVGMFSVQAYQWSTTCARCAVCTLLWDVLNPQPTFKGR